MRYKKRKKAASQVMAMAVLVVAVLAVLFGFGEQPGVQSAEHSGRRQPQSAQG